MGLTSRRAALAVLSVYGVLFLIGQIASANGFIINHTDSAPMGVWRVQPLSGPVEHGQMVGLCPPDEAPFRLGRERGYLFYGRCPGRYEPLLKRVAAVAGDTVEVASEGVRVNGQLLPNSAPLIRDGTGAPLDAMPAKAYAVADGEIWLVSTYNPGSFDSRYFGPVKVGQLEGVASPVWISTSAPAPAKESS